MSTTTQPGNQPTKEAKRAALDIFADIETPPPKYPHRGIRSKAIGKTHLRPLAWTHPPTLLPHQVFIKTLSPRDRRKLRRRIYLNKLDDGRHKKTPGQYLSDIEDMLKSLQRDTRAWALKGRHKEVLVPEETIALLTGISEMTMRENIFYVHVHNGCRVHVLHPRESEGRHRKVILTGSQTVMELVEERIKHMADRQAGGDPLIEIRPPPVPVYPSIEALHRKNYPVPLVHGVWDYYTGLSRPKNLDVLLAMRDLTTVKEFCEYVEDLTLSQPSDVTRQRGSTRNMEVAKALMKEFREEGNWQLVSSAALNRALGFLYSHEFIHDARTLFQKSENVATVDTFNIILKASAKSLDLRTFKSVLHTMRALNIRPNEWTWLAFLDCHASPQQRIKLAAHLLQQGHITTISLRSALQLTIQDVFSAHLARGEDVDSFMNMMVNTYGTNWFSVSLINQMFSVTARRRDHLAMQRLLDICDEQRLSLKSSTLNQILLLYRDDIFPALQFSYRIMGRNQFSLERDTYERLFLVAFKSRRYNISRVIWRYACTQKSVSYKMKSAVLDSLACDDASQRKNLISRLFELNAGKVIVGIDSRLDEWPIDHPIISELPAEFRKQPLLYLVTALRRPGSDPDLRRRLASALVHRDIKIGPLYKALYPMSIMLQAAAVVDYDWGYVKRPTNFLLQNAIVVPMERKDRPRPRRQKRTSWHAT